MPVGLQAAFLLAIYYTNVTGYFIALDGNETQYFMLMSTIKRKQDTKKLR
jgi:hypothetical protein